MKTDFLCPLCSVPMTIIPGTELNIKDGFTVVCRDDKCPSHENVYGHGKSEKDAHEVACQKYKKSKES